MALLLGATGLAAIARRIGVPYPSLLAIGGAALAFVPGAPQFTLEPDLALALFVAPVLLDAAYDASPRDLRAYWVPITGLVIVAVGLTTAAVAVVAHALVPGMPWAAAIALGAIVAPPDAAAATAVLRQLRLPHRLVMVLEAESLFNDASALLIYRVAVAAVAAGAFSVKAVAPTFALVVIASLACGVVLGWLYSTMMGRITDAPSAIVLQFIGTFGVWILAERIGLSGILTVVSYAMVIARHAPWRASARLRVSSYAVWDTAIFVLNVLAFVLIGLQLRPILGSLPEAVVWQYVAIAAAVLATVIVVRVGWVMTYAAAMRAAHRLLPERWRPPLSPPTVRGGLIVSWCGMRGIVTLAAALALPIGVDGAAFPYRDLILFCAFAIVLGTLVLQGLTLRPLIRALALPDDGFVAREANEARRRAIQAVLHSLRDDTSPAAEQLRAEYEEARQQADSAGDETVPLARDELRSRAIHKARKEILRMRRAGEIGDDAFHRAELELDMAELFARRREYEP